jgi:hypothetical protein
VIRATFVCVLCLWALPSCAAHSVSVGRDEPALTVDAGHAEATAHDAGFDAEQLVADPSPSQLDAATSDAAPAEPPDAALPPAQCTGNNADCDHDPKNGCEVDLSDDPLHCGRCETACQYPDCACQAGVLTLVCPQGRANCDGDARNGCETDIESSMQNCGSCGRLCHTMGHDATGAVCMAGHCHITCRMHTFGQGDCDDNPDNGCETNIWTNENCGQCGVKCTCVDGTCR